MNASGIDIDQLPQNGAETQIIGFTGWGNAMDVSTDRIVSGLASGEEALAALQSLGVVPISYSGPSAVHSIVHVAAVREGLRSISLWGHCPYYLQGTTHYGLLATLAGMLGKLAGFSVDTAAIEDQWAKVGDQIRSLVKKNPELKAMIDNLRKAKVRGTWDGATRCGDSKVIDIRGFFKSPYPPVAAAPAAPPAKIACRPPRRGDRTPRPSDRPWGSRRPGGNGTP